MVSGTKEIIQSLRKSGMSRSEIRDYTGYALSTIGRCTTGLILSDEIKNKIRERGMQKSREGYKKWLMANPNHSHLKEAKEKAIELRKQGETIPQIAKTINVARSSVCNWVKGVQLPDDYKEKLKRMRAGYIIKYMSNHVSPNKGKLLKRKYEIIDGVEYLWCYKCKQMVKRSDFYKKKNGTRDETWCRPCLRDHVKQYFNNLRHRVVITLGGYKCYDCGCDDYELLEIHHNNRNGKDERKRLYAMFKKIIAMGDTAREEYSVLCKVCHVAKHIGPHYIITWKPLNTFETNTYVTTLR
jgi:hypothetical protein